MSEFLNGDWIGYYTYGEMYPENLRTLKSGYEMKLYASGDSFSGTCADDDMKGKLDVPANINGKVDSHSITFTKQYPFFFSIDGRGNVIKDESQTPSIIHYSGNYDPGSNICSGKWKIIMMQTVGPNEAVEKIFGGDWSIKKK